jgi:UDP-N-acetylglucosamine/UDP-N-acetylgalactosamine diphosphorylase
MHEVPEKLFRRLREAGQEHVLAGWETLAGEQRAALLSQLERINLEQLGVLYSQRDQQTVVPAEERIAPIPLTAMDAGDCAAGEEALRRGEVAVLIVAGGQGSRLGFEHPKGLFPIGPVRNTPLFQILAEKTLARQRRHGKPIPFLVMTSPATHEETVAFFEQHHHFGLSANDVAFFCQGTMPALDLATGRLLMAEPGRLFLSPNGHGGTLLGLEEAGLLDALSARGIKHIFYCQVDNPLVRVADPCFLGHHIRAGAEVSTKAIAKNGPLDKLGNLVLVDGSCSIIEYSDLPERLARQPDPDGRLRIRVGNPAIHVFDIGFLKRVTSGELRMPFHVARKKVPYTDAHGQLVEPKTENALKFEMFIFDVLPMAQRWTVVETDRQVEFHPVKNASGSDSPDTVRLALCNEAAAWLERAGVPVSRQANGDPAEPLEISPLFALDADELASKVNGKTRIAGPAYFG